MHFVLCVYACVCVCVCMCDVCVCVYVCVYVCCVCSDLEAVLLYLKSSSEEDGHSNQLLHICHQLMTIPADESGYVCMYMCVCLSVCSLSVCLSVCMCV